MVHPPLVQVLRGGAVESMHRGSLAVVDADGALRLALGDVDRLAFPRSAVKLLQALPLVASGAADELRLTDDELALACASHGGEPGHVVAARSMLAKAGLDEAALECGTHWPGQEEAARALARDGAAPGPLHNNCSGKHAGFVCLGCLMARARGMEPREFVRGYVRPDHPVMREVGAALSAATGADLTRAPTGIDGCSIPTYGIALRDLARGFARAGTGIGMPADLARAAARLRGAIARAPWFVAGTGRADTRLMQALGERLCCKVGAEGVYCAALPALGLGLAIKIDDGNNARAAEVVLAALVDALLPMDEAGRAVVRQLMQPALRNWNGIDVGALTPAPELRAALDPLRAGA